MGRRKRPKRSESTPVEGELVPAEPAGALQSDILQENQKIAQDVRMIRQVLGFGCIPQAKVDALMLRIYERAMSEEISDRDLKNVVSLLRDFAKLELDLEKLQEPVRHQHAHLHAHGTVDTERHRLSEIASRAGLPTLYK